jgi:hypothetical protein
MFQTWPFKCRANFLNCNYNLGLAGRGDALSDKWSLIRNGKKQLFSLRKLPCDCEVRSLCMCKEMAVIPVNTVVDKKRIIGKNGGPRRRTGIRGR